MIHKFLRSLLAVSVCLACSEPLTEPGGPDPEPPSITLTKEFGDPPLAGSILLTGLPGSGTWRYAIDVDDDGTPEVEGTLSPGDQRSLPYALGDAGVHTIRIELRNGDRVERVDRFVVVNDASFVRDVRSFEVPGATSGFEGIAINEELGRLYLGEASKLRIYMLSLDDFRVLDVADNEGPRNTLEGFAFDDSEQLLYVLDKSGILQVFDGQTLVRTHEFHLGDARYFIALTPLSVLWVSAPSLIALDQGMAVTVLDHSLGVWHFDLYGKGQKILFSMSDGVGVADAAGNIVWQKPLSEGLFGKVVAFSPDARDAYVFASLDNREWKFLRFDVESGALEYEMDLGPCESQCWGGAANPIARTAGGRFLAIPTFAGAYFIDTEIGLPRFRTPAPGDRFCCDVAAVGDNTLIFANGMVVTIDAAIPSATEMNR